MLSHVMSLAARSKTILISHHIYDNWRMKRRFVAGDIESTSGSTHTSLALQDSLCYIDRAFDDYLVYSRLFHAALRDKRVLEIGPGDNLGVALKFLLAGARQVVCLDKFSSRQDCMQQRSIYRAMREALNDDEKQLFDAIVDPEVGLPEDSAKLVSLFGRGIEEAEQVLEPESFDLIMSRAVFEHVYDPERAFSVMHRLLKPGGYMLHKIDFRDHGIFSKHQHHPLTFLTIPDSVYRLMVYDSGKPNRKLLPYYRNKAAGSGFTARFLITHIVVVENEIVPHKEEVISNVDYSDLTLSLLKSIRPRLQEEFKNMSDADLMVSGIFLIAQKH
jgi:SAM-dependent methyltransferase